MRPARGRARTATSGSPARGGAGRGRRRSGCGEGVRRASAETTENGSCGPGRVRTRARGSGVCTGCGRSPGRGRLRSPHGTGRRSTRRLGSRRQALRRPARAARHQPVDRSRRGRRGHRPVRLGQVHAVPGDQPPRADRRRDDPARRRPLPAEGRALARLRADVGHGVPVVQPVRPPDRAAERHRRADQGPQDAQARGRERGPRRCSTGSASRARRTSTRRSCPAVSSSASPSPGRWRWSPR